MARRYSVEIKKRVDREITGGDSMGQGDLLTHLPHRSTMKYQ